MSTSNQGPIYETAKTKHLQAQCYRGSDSVRQLTAGCMLGLVAGFISLNLLTPCISGSAEAAEEMTVASATNSGFDNGTCWREISPEESANADFATPVPANVTAYLAANKCANLDGIISLFETARARAERAGYKPPSLLLACCIARWETGAKWNLKARGKAGERGLLQIHPIHDSSMRKAGLDPLDVDDQLLYGMMLYGWHGLKPWAVKAKALRDYREWAE